MIQQMAARSNIPMIQQMAARSNEDKIPMILATTEERSPTAANARGGAAALACGGLCGDGAARGERNERLRWPARERPACEASLSLPLFLLTVAATVKEFPQEAPSCVRTSEMDIICTNPMFVSVHMAALGGDTWPTHRRTHAVS
jgi:hypothetical protein